MEYTYDYRIKLANGEIIENIRKSSTTYICKNILNPEIFKGNCNPIVIIDKDNVEHNHNNMKLANSYELDGEYYLIFNELTCEEILNNKLRSDIDYIAMMTDIELIGGDI